MSAKVIDWIEQTTGAPEDVILDEREGLHCAECRKSGENVPVLLNNPEIPRVVCWECFAREMLQ